MTEKKFRFKKNSTPLNSLHNIEVRDDGEANWLISYADLMTLLFAFFVLLTAFSTPSSDKFEKLREATAKSMGGTYTKPFNELSDELKTVLSEMNISSSVKIENLTEGLILTASTTRFFASASDKLDPEAEEILIQLAEILKKKAGGFKIIVEGHTDDVPINRNGFTTNWDLSLSRASQVVKLFEKHGIAHESLRPVGLSDIEPRQKTDGLSGEALTRARELNRRIVIKIIKNLAK